MPSSSEFEVVNHQALKLKHDLLNVDLHKISTELQLEYEKFLEKSMENSIVIKYLNTPNNALFTAIYNYGNLLDIATEVKRLYELYRSSRINERNYAFKKFQFVRRKISMAISLVINRSEEIAESYEKFIKMGIKYGKMLKNIKNSKSKNWNDVAFEDKAELIEIIFMRLITCTELIDYCNRMQFNCIESLTPMIDIFKNLEDTSTMSDFVENGMNLVENQWNLVTNRHVKRSINLMLEKIVRVGNPVYIKIQKFNNASESFKADIRRWMEKAYDGELIEDSDSDTQFSFNNRKKIQLDITLVSDNFS